MNSVSALGSLADGPVVVVGGEFGGLSTACYLMDAGTDVTLLEKNEQLGGRTNTLEHDDFRFSMRPSWYLIPDVFEHFFVYFGRRPEDCYKLTRLGPYYRVLFRDDDRVDMLPDITANEATSESYESGAGDRLDDYLRKAERNYRIGMEHFVYADRPALTDCIDLDVFWYSRELLLVDSMQDRVENYFDHPKLQQIIQYTLVFLGGMSSDTPALYNLMSHVDFNMGICCPDDGLAGVVSTTVDLAGELGIKFHTDSPVAEIAGRRSGFAVRTENGREFLCDQVVSDADYTHIEQELLPEKKHQYDADYWDSRTYAPSAFLLYLGVEGDVDELACHTLVLPTDWGDCFETIFDDPAWSDDPVYYPCMPSRTDDSVAPEGHSSLFALVPIAAELEDTPEHRERYRDLVLDNIAKNIGVDLRDRIVLEESLCVNDFKGHYNSTQGTALGLAHTLFQAALLRPPRGSDAIDGLYSTGSFTTSGIGTPMCLISSQLTAEEIAGDAR